VANSTTAEIRGTNAAVVTSAALVAQQVGGKAARDALFLSTFHADSLPIVMAAGAALSLAAVLWLSRLMARHSPARVLPVVLAVSSCGLTLEWGVGFVSPPVAAVLVYLHTATFSPVMISSFWSLINERFDPHAAKAAVARIGTGATFGGVVGGLLAWRAASLVSLPTTVLCLAGLNAACFVGTVWFRAYGDPSKTPAPTVTSSVSTPASPPTSALATLRAAPFLRNLALLVALGAAMSALLDYVFSVQATAVYPKGAPLLAFFSLFWLAVSVVSLVVQLTLGRIAMERLGLAVNIAVLPGIIIMGGAVGMAVPGLVSSALLRGAESIQRNTLFRSAYELLYTPLSEERKRVTKALIDVGFDRFGTVIGSGVALLTIQLFVDGPSRVLLGAVVVFAICTLPVARRLQTGYVAALEEGLREGEKKLEVPHFEATRQSLGGNRDGVVRDELVQRAEALHPPEASPAADGVAQPAYRDAEALLARGAEVLSGDPQRARKALETWPASEPRFATFAILLLGDKDLYPAAQVALRRVAKGVTGQLVDVLLDPQADTVTRRRVPRVLASCPTQRSADGLVLGIADERFEVRYECGRALLKLTDLDPKIVVSRETVFAAVLREAEKRSAEVVATEEYDEEAAGAESLAFVENLLARDRLDRRLEHIFTILSLHFERDPLRMAYRALHLEDTGHRGTALEYLATVLPKELSAAVWPFLGEAEPLPVARPSTEILRDLIHATTASRASRSAREAL
jgi:AAA family ATP:ADP antiporter